MPLLATEKRHAIQALHRHGVPHGTISKKLRVHIDTVKRWARRDDLTGSVAPRHATGRPRKMPAEACKRALELLCSAEFGLAPIVAKKIYEEGLTNGKVAPQTVIRNVKRYTAEHGDKLICLRGRPPKLLTRDSRTKRTAFAKKARNRTWRPVMFTDRCRFYWRYPGSAVQGVRYCLRSQKHAEGVYSPNKPMCYNVYGGITRFGPTKLHAVAGTSKAKSQYLTKQGKISQNITMAEYRDVLTKTLLKEGRRIFSTQGMHAFVLQQDNDPCHSAARGVVREWNSKRGGGVVDILPDWPGNSPDLSPIENVWAWVDRKVSGIKCNTFEEFCRAVDKSFASVPRSMLENLFDSVPERLELCIAMDGHRTRY